MKTSDLAAIFLAVISATLLLHGFIRESWQILLVGVFAAMGAGWILVEPEMSARRAAKNVKITDEPEVASVDNHSAKSQAQIELFETPLVSSASTQTQRALEQELKGARESAAELKKEIAKWQHTSMEYVDFLDWVLGLDGLDDKCSQAFNKARVELIKKMGEHGIVEIRPKAGDEYDDRVHAADRVADTEGSEPRYIKNVERSGFAIGSKVIRPSKVNLE